MEIPITTLSIFFMIVLTIIQIFVERKRTKLCKDVTTIEENITRLRREVDTNLARLNELANELNNLIISTEPTGPPTEYKTPNDLLTELGYQQTQRPARFDTEGKYLEN